MCGIAGYYGNFSREQLIRGSRLQAHRGPDANAEWFDDRAGVGLAHRRLSIIDLSPTGAQPMRCPETGAVIVFNGEIYNFRELREELQGKAPDSAAPPTLRSYWLYTLATAKRC